MGAQEDPGDGELGGLWIDVLLGDKELLRTLVLPGIRAALQGPAGGAAAGAANCF